MLSLQNVSFQFSPDADPAINQLSLTVQAGELLVILGSSGSGKSTLLRLCNGLRLPTAGKVTVEGEDTRHCDLIKLRRRMGFVFQRDGLFPHISILENVAMVLRVQGVAKAKRQQQARQALLAVNLDPDKIAERMPRELSGGQRQRVGIARALVADPKILLMDEPFAALDAINRESLQQEVLKLKNNLSKTIIFVTHDIKEAFHLADRIAIMQHGKLLQIDTPQAILANPASHFVRELLETQQRTTSLVEMAEVQV